MNTGGEALEWRSGGRSVMEKISRIEQKLVVTSEWR
jgi:hypothetical protein